MYDLDARLEIVLKEKERQIVRNQKRREFEHLRAEANRAQADGRRKGGVPLLRRVFAR